MNNSEQGKLYPDCSGDGNAALPPFPLEDLNILQKPDGPNYSFDTFYIMGRVKKPNRRQTAASLAHKKEEAPGKG